MMEKQSWIFPNHLLDDVAAETNEFSLPQFFKECCNFKKKKKKRACSHPAKIQLKTSYGNSAQNVTSISVFLGRVRHFTLYIKSDKEATRGKDHLENAYKYKFDPNTKGIMDSFHRCTELQDWYSQKQAVWPLTAQNEPLWPMWPTIDYSLGKPFRSCLQEQLHSTALWGARTWGNDSLIMD